MQGFESISGGRILTTPLLKMQGFESFPTVPILGTQPGLSTYDRRMRTLLGAVAAVLVVTGCSSSDGGSDPAAPASTPAAARSLRDTCPLLEQATPTSLLPSSERLRAYSTRLGELSMQGDAETQAAIRYLQDATTELTFADQGTESADAFAGMTDALRMISDRCAAVGSSAFQ